MDAVEIQEKFNTKEGQVKLASLFHTYGKDHLRQMCMDMSQIIINQQVELDSLKLKGLLDQSETDKEEGKVYTKDQLLEAV